MDKWIEDKYKEDDGWNEEAFVRFLEGMHTLSNISYEIRMCKRARSLSELSEEIGEAIENLQETKEEIDIALKQNSKEEEK